MKIHALVFYDSIKLIPLDHRVYTVGITKYDRQFVREFVEFGRKEFLFKMDVPEDQFVIEIADGAFLIYITKTENVGCALLLSCTPELNVTPHLVSKMLIDCYLRDNSIPEKEGDILVYFKHKEVLKEVKETKKVLMRSVSQILERGEKIEDLVDKTETLSETSKVFFKQSRKLNSCCWIFPRWFW